MDTLPVITLKLATVTSEKTNRGLMCNRFSELVYERSAGKITVNMYHDGCLGDSTDIIEGLEYGTADIVVNPIGYLAQYTGAQWLAWESAYVYEDYASFQQFWAEDGYGNELLKRCEDETDFVCIGPSLNSINQFFSNTEIRTPDDFNGLNVRTTYTEKYVAMIMALGADPVPMNFAGTDRAFQQGILDAVECSLSDAYLSDLYRSCQYVSLTDHFISTDCFMLNKMSFDNLPKEYQLLLRECALEAAKWRTEKELQDNEKYLPLLKEKGMTVIDDIDKALWSSQFKASYGKLESEIQEVIDKIPNGRRTE